MSYFLKSFFLFFLTLQIYSCKSGLNRISGRVIGTHPENMQASFPMSYEPSKSELSDNIYKKDYQKKIMIEKEMDDNPSLYRIKSPKNKFFNHHRFPEIGQILKFKIKNTKIKKDTDPEAAEQEENGNDELLNAIPSLAPPAEDDTYPLRDLAMRVEQILPNGDLVLSYTKNTRLNKDRRKLRVQAVLGRDDFPSQKKDLDKLHTGMLKDIEFTDIYKHDTQIFKSLDWDDAYTLRLSNYHEQRSRYAVQIENKRKKLEEISESVEKRIRSSNQQRKKWTAEREKWQRAKAKEEERIEKLSDQVKSQQDKITSQSDKIADLTKQAEELRRQSEQLAGQAEDTLREGAREQAGEAADEAIGQ